MTEKPNQADFIFICGAVGSGNTFLFECLSNNKNIYGINEDGLGALLSRFLRSENDFGFCPHSTQTFKKFAYELRGEKKTLLLKTPSNLAHIEALRETLPNSAFVVTLRDPHASIVSGARRHGRGLDFAADEWKKDAMRIFQVLDRVSILTYEQMMRDPVIAMQKINDWVMPLDNAASAYASQISDPTRTSPEWWKRGCSKEEVEHVNHLVGNLELDSYYKKIAGDTADQARVATSGKDLSRRRIDAFRRRATKAFFRARRKL